MQVVAEITGVGEGRHRSPGAPSETQRVCNIESLNYYQRLPNIPVRSAIIIHSTIRVFLIISCFQYCGTMLH